MKDSEDKQAFFGKINNNGISLYEKDGLNLKKEDNKLELHRILKFKYSI